MTRLFHTGWELGSLIPTFNKNNTNGTIKTDIVRNGTYSFEATTSYGFDGPGSRDYGYQLASAIAEGYIRVPFYCTAIANTRKIVYFTDSADGNQCGLSVNSTTGKLQVQLGDGTVIATATDALTLNVWPLIDIHFLINNTTGVFDVKVNGGTSGQGLTFAGDTQLTANANVGYVYLANNQGRYDDFAMNDTAGSLNNSWIGEGRSGVMVPSGAGTTTQLTRGGTDSGANWSQAEEIPTDDVTTYNYDSAGTNQKDTYAMGNLSNVASVNAVMQYARAQKNDAGTGNFRHVIRSGGTDYDNGSDIALTESWAWYKRMLETDPATSAAWTAANLDAVEAGFDAR